MLTKNEYLITQMKLHELRQQRVRLLQAYDALEQRVEQAATRKEQLTVLVNGLQEMKMAEIAIHPDVANLKLLLESGQFSDETVSFWSEQLRKELLQGRLRSEMIYIFGALLEEWVQEKSQEVAPEVAQVQTVERLLEELAYEQPVPDLSLVDELFAERSRMGKDIAPWFQQFAATMLQERITTSELNDILKELSSSPEYTETIRRQAQGFLQNTVMCKEMADALSLALVRLDEWNWPEDGVTAFPFWTLNKWRVLITYDLFTMCLLEVLGVRLQKAFLRFVEAEQMERVKQAKELLKDAPAEDADAVLQQALDLYRLSDSNIWANLRGISLTLNGLKDFFAQNFYYCVIWQRQQLRHKMEHASIKLSGYRALHSNETRNVWQYIHAEIQLARAAFPQDPLYVLKLDLKDFYPSLSHDLLLKVLEQYGFSAEHVNFFRTFLRIHASVGGEQRHFLRGVPLHHSFSNVLGEMVLRLLDQHLLRRARVQIIRLVDDICILAPTAEEAVNAWHAAHEFCQRLGLALNLEKCGAVCIGGALPEQLPITLPRWSLVQLNQHGEWAVDMEAFADYLAQAREQVLQHSSLLGQIEAYNFHVKRLLYATATHAQLDKTHRLSTTIVATHFHTAFFGEEVGMVEALRKTIQERFLKENTALVLPEAWLYWPITAGGSGLSQAIVLAGAYAESHSLDKKRNVPAKRSNTWQIEHNDWMDFYSSFILPVLLKAPEATPGMEVLVHDFIRRSNEMGNDKQKTLSPYWRWILYLYGPQILDQLGTFRFLSTELVPLQIILQYYNVAPDTQDTTLDEISIQSNISDVDASPF